MKKIICTILLLICILSTAVSAEEFKFSDVKESDWFYSDVVSAVEMGLINGKGVGTYCPNDNLTYAEAVKLAACMYEKYTTGKVTLQNGNPWYKTYFDYCTENNIIYKKYESFPFNEKATRSGYMEIFANALPDEALEPINYVPDDSIPDVLISDAYGGHVYKLYRAGIVAGSDAAHNCKPASNIKRSEVAAILARMMNKDKRVKFSIGEEVPKLEIPEDAEPVPLPSEEPEQPKENEDVPENYPTFKIVSQPKAVSGAEEDEMIQYTVKVEGGKEPYTYCWYTRARYNQLAKINENDYVVGTNKNTLSVLYNIENPLSDSSFCCEIKDALGQTVKTNYIKMPEPPLVMNIEQVQTVMDQKLFVGRIERGSLKVGDYVVVYVKDKDIYGGGRVTKITMFNKNIDEVNSGDYCGIVLDNIDMLVPLGFVEDSYSQAFIQKIWEKNGFAIKLPLRAQIDAPVADKGGAVRFEAYVAGGKAPYTYQWQVINITLPNPEYQNIYWVDNTTSSITFETAEIEYVSERFYRCIVRDADGNEYISNESCITPSSTVYIVFTSHTFYANHGDDVEMQVKLKAPIKDIPYIEYQWQYKLQNHSDFKDITPADTWADGINTDTITIHVENADFQDNILYRCKVTLPNVTSFTTDTYQILPENVVICKHPKNVTGQHAEKVQFKVEAKGQNGPFTYQWLIQTPDNEAPLRITDGFTWAEGQYTDTLTVAVDSKKLTSDYKFSCIVTDANGKKTYSKEAYVIVTEAPNVDLRDSSESKSDMIVLLD